MRWFPVLAVLALLGFLIWVLFAPKGAGIPGGEPPGSRVPDGEMAEAGSEQEPGRDRAQEEPVIHSPDPVLRAELQSLQASLAAQPGREEVLRLLQEFFARWLQTDPNRAAATLLEFLRLGKDQGTGLKFAVGEAGLEEWPTLRAFLLDLLGKIDPGLASRYALEAVIPAKNSTTEYAVSLQILWNHGGAEKPTPELTQAWLGLLRKADWSVRPDAAWMESLDFASRIPEAAPEFLQLSTAWLTQPQAIPARVAAVDLALERMAVREPVATMGALVRDPALLNEGRGIYQRSLIFARAGLADPPQQALLARYLERLDPADREAQFFFHAFPCRNFSVSPGLSGQPRLASALEIMAGDRAALLWLESQRHASWMMKHPEGSAQILKKIKKIVDEQ